ncbi:beta-galactosidase GalB [Caecibacteroides pullorum]|nr:beta-galactosidase GalB [Caecibacteroides pullorum]MDC6281433.1 glycoside hydrolase family 2 TIM barrel-domain containing protein [Caecibacteroides pullorum]
MKKQEKMGWAGVCLLCLLTWLGCSPAGESGKMVRSGQVDVVSLNEGWTFARYGLQADGTLREEPEGMYATGWDDSSWRKLDVPHDFAIEGPFRMDLSGNTGRLPYQGIGWYRKSFVLDSTDADKRIYVDFDGVMAYAQVWLNGQYVGGWPYGYNSFRLDLTPYVRTGGENLLAVRTDTEKWESRWYPGAGIYRNVWLVKTGQVQVKHWSARMRTACLTESTARLDLSLEVENHLDKDVEAVVKGEVYELDSTDCFGRRVLRLPAQEVRLSARSAQAVKLEDELDDYKRWDIGSPNRYVARLTVSVGGQVTDRYDVPFGIRETEFSRQGFFLNGRKVALQGVCLHHDLGALGAAFNLSAQERQLRIMQEMGCNAIRTSHNPPAPELLDLADKMGLLVMDEAFDAWARGKRTWDYNKLYNEWHEKDLQAMVRRDWNHPSVIIWSIGNEVMEQRDVEMTRHLAGIVRELDDTRPVTAGYNNPNGGRDSNAARELDLMGVNYFFGQQARWDEDERYKDMPTVGTETSSCVSTRGVYFMGDTLRKNFQISSYDLDSPGWGCSPDRQFATNARFPHLLGEFVWTGFDYLGEPTPYNSDNTNLLNFRTDPSKQEELKKKLEELARIQPPSRSSYFGIVDLAGFPKDRYYLYQSHWRPELPMAHILPHWNWPDRIGQVVPVHVYTSGTEAELFVNGKSWGRRSKREGQDFRLVWDSVVYQPGSVRVVAYKNGQKWAEDEVQTTGEARKIRLEADRNSLDAGSRELAFVTVRLTDEEGRTVPTACCPLKFEVEGAGELVATDNGDPISFTPFQSAEREAFNGLALAIVRARKGAAGEIRVRVSGEGLEPAVLQLEAR